MPKAGASTTGPALRRNQACKQCRRRKLKCDAAKPHCSTCKKAWTAQIAVPPPVGYSHPPEPPCDYDHMEGLTLTPENVSDPNQRMKLLETQIAELQNKLSEAQKEAGVPPSAQDSISPQLPSALTSSSSNVVMPLPSSSRPWASQLPEQSSLVSRMDTQEISNFGHVSSSTGRIEILKNNEKHPGNVNMDVELELSTNPQSEHYSGYELKGSHPAYSTPMELMYSGWNPDLPEPRLLHHLTNLFFLRDACASRIIHRPTFMLAMTLPPTHPDFPHPAILHAICASASRWTAAYRNVATNPTTRDRFAEFHAAKTRTFIDQTVATGQNIFSVLIACIILSWWYYAEGRWVEVWSHAGFLTRMCIPLGLNFPGTHPTHPNAAPYLAPPRNPTDLEQRRRAWWMCVMFDRIVSVGGWPHSIDERDIGTELPLRRIDFENESSPPVPSNPQDLTTENFLIRHNPVYTDPYLLFLKAMMLFGKVTEYNTRMVNLRAPRQPSKPSPTASPVDGTSNVPGSTFRGDPRMAAGFRSLDRLVSSEFLSSLPPGMKSCLGVQDASLLNKTGAVSDMQVPSISIDINGTALDTDLYMAHIIPHAATITLHNPYLNGFTDPQDQSAARCLVAARSIVNAYYLLTSTSFDIKRLHPFIVICWYLAAVVMVQSCKRCIELGDSVREASIWGEINVMRMAMKEYGTISPIGTRQEKLLQGLMTEILRMTSHPQPLSMGVPLYPFSKKTLYDPKYQPTLSEVLEDQKKAAALGGSETAPTTTSAGIGSAAASMGAGLQASSSNPSIGAVDGLFSYDDMASLGLVDSMMLSSQGIWHPLDDLPPGADGVNSLGMDIFKQLGL